LFAYFEKDKETGEVSFVYRHSNTELARVGSIKPGQYKFSMNFRPPLKARDDEESKLRWAGRGTTTPISITVHEFLKVKRPREVDGWKP
jgi:hypothetical protein